LQRVAEQNVRGGHYQWQERPMRVAKPQPIRNKIDLADPMQIRAWSRRLGVTADELKGVVGKVGNSVAGVSKEIDLRKATPTAPVRIDPAAVPTLETVAADATPVLATVNS
jgi:hypothetical protein